MILLDTEVVAEAIEPEPRGSVRDRLDAQAAGTLFVSSVTLAEVLFGVRVLAKGKRRDRLGAAVDGVIEVFDGRALPFEMLAARHDADLAARARAAGKGFPTPDGCIAAIAAAHGLVVASRDAGAFAAAGLRVIDPWREFP